jgi:hypothetical protein
MLSSIAGSMATPAPITTKQREQSVQSLLETRGTKLLYREENHETLTKLGAVNECPQKVKDFAAVFAGLSSL